MALALQKKKKREDKRNTTEVPTTNSTLPGPVVIKQESLSLPLPDLRAMERGRRIDKGKTAKISVVGFDTDCADDPEYVCVSRALFFVGTDLFFR